MSGLSPELRALLTRDNELERLEKERTKRPRRGLAAEVAKEVRAAEKAMRAAELRLSLARRAASILRAAPGLTMEQLKALVKKGARGR